MSSLCHRFISHSAASNLQVDVLVEALRLVDALLLEPRLGLFRKQCPFVFFVVEDLTEDVQRDECSYDISSGRGHFTICGEFCDHNVDLGKRVKGEAVSTCREGVQHLFGA